MSAEPNPERRRRERRRADEQRFWRALRGERRVAERRREEPTGAPAAEPLSPHEARRVALRRLLQAAEARQDRASRERRPVLAHGARVRVLRGELAGHVGTVADADYIEGRVLLALDGGAPPCWVTFEGVGAAD